MELVFLPLQDAEVGLDRCAVRERNRQPAHELPQLGKSSFANSVPAVVEWRCMVLAVDYRRRRRFVCERLVQVRWVSFNLLNVSLLPEERNLLAIGIKYGADKVAGEELHDLIRHDGWRIELRSGI